MLLLDYEMNLRTIFMYIFMIKEFKILIATAEYKEVGRSKSKLQKMVIHYVYRLVSNCKLGREKASERNLGAISPPNEV